MPSRSRESAPLELTVVIPYADDEDVVGTGCRRLATYLRAQELSFELLAVDEDSHDNSSAVLSMLRSSLPELCTISAPRGRGFVASADSARGRVVVLVDPSTAATRTLAPLGRAVRRVARGELDLAAVASHFVVAKRTRALPTLRTLRHRPSFVSKAIRVGRKGGLQVESYQLGGQRPHWPRWVSALIPAARS